MREMLIQLEVDQGDRRWQERANCLGVDPDLFFPERGASTKEAKGVCHGCEVQPDCLEYALRHGEKFGIWGGMSERERRAHPAPARPRPARHRQRLARPAGDPGLDRRGLVEPGPGPEVGRAALELGPGQQPDQLHRGDIGAARRVRRRAPLRTRRSIPVRARSVTFIETCARPAAARKKPSARTPGSPPSRSRTTRAAAPRDLHVGGVEQAVDRDERRAHTHRGRAELRVRLRRARGPAPRCRNASRRVVGQRPALRVGVVVEEHRAPRATSPTSARTRAPRRVAAAGSPVERDERHHVERAESRVDAFVRRDRNARRDLAGQASDRVGQRARVGCREREHRTVVIGDRHGRRAAAGRTTRPVRRSRRCRARPTRSGRIRAWPERTGR